MACKRTFNISYIKSKTWSYNGGFKIGNGDFIEFEKSNLFEIKDDTIYYNHLPKATIESVDKEGFLLKLKSIDGNKKSQYRNIEESFK